MSKEGEQLKGRVLGFTGLDVQDTMLYLSRIFYHMGKKVLMMDYSESRALYYSIPVIPGLDVNTMIVEYRDTYFTCRKIAEKELEEFDVILIFFGFTERAELKLCNYLVYTTDYEKNHIERLARIKGSGAVYTQLVYRNAGKPHRKEENLFEIKVCESSPYYCNDNEREKRLRRQCQYNDSYGFHGISGSFRKYLLDTVRAVFPKEAEGKGFEESFRRAEMGV